MRFVLAIVAFVVAAVMIVAGIAQRTVFAPPSEIAASATIKGQPRYIVIDGSVLNAHPGQQTLSVSGAGDAKSQVVAYGRTADVRAWLAGEKYVSVGYDHASGTFTTKSVVGKQAPAGGQTDASGTAPSAPTATATATATPAPTPGAGAATPSPSPTAAAKGPNPAGSDLWLEEFDGTDAQVTRMNVPENISVIIAGDGTSPAPDRIRVAWPVDSSTPWAFPLIIGGLVLLVIGIVLYLWGLYAHRRARGPRRKGGPKMPKLPKTPRYKPTKAMETTPRGRRSTRRVMIAVPLALIGALAANSGAALAAAPAEHLATALRTATDVPKAKGQLPPAVTVPQLERIVKRISVTAMNADAKADPALAAERFAGPALELRKANYAIRAKKADQPPLAAIPASPIVLSLPQATDTWPRSVTAVVQPPKDAQGAVQAPIALTMVQETPRDNYLVTYAVSLEPKAKVPDLAPASIGSAVVPPDSKLLKLPPKDLAAAYADVLLNGDASKSAALFDANGDTLRTQVGAEWKAKQKAELQQKFGATSSLTFTNAVGSGPTIAMATNDSGAIVWTNLDETQTLKVVEAGAQVDAGPTSAALSGVASSKTGIASTYGYQLAFYVPPAGSSSKISLLGFAQGLVAAKEVQ